MFFSKSFSKQTLQTHQNMLFQSTKELCRFVLHYQFLTFLALYEIQQGSNLQRTLKRLIYLGHARV